MRVSIRPLQESDALVSYKWRNDPEVFKYTGNVYNNIITLETELAWIRRVIQNENEYRCAILVDDEYVGNIYLTDITRTTAAYHIFIGNKDFWGKGVARTASELILEYAFDVLKLEYVYLRVKRENERALWLYKSLGFIIEESDDVWVKMKKKFNIAVICLLKMN
ncbi:MAG: GNAT family N-acetyltransferase [Paludibacteraceae bacterium]|nr:GNAT family N-acetyltransferase [Paludibacteraceae bacterium]